MIEISLPDMEHTHETQTDSPSPIMYIVGIVLVVVVIAGAWYFRSRSSGSPVVAPTVMEQSETTTTPTPGPITELVCDQVYFNPKIAFNEYYLSVEGGDLPNAESIKCAFTASVDETTVASATANSPLSDAPQRNGKTFRCTTNAVALEPSVETNIDVVLTDDLGKSATCGATFIFPPQQ